MAGVPSRAGGGEAGSWPPGFGGGRGGPGDFAVCWKRREAQVCPAHQRGQSVSGLR